MSVELVTEYPGRVLVDANNPRGTFLNSSVPGLYDGTPGDQAWGRDIWGFLDRIEELDGYPSSGVPDNALNSQRYDALTRLGRNNWPVWDAGNVYLKGVMVIGSDNNAYQSLQIANQNNNPLSSPAWWKLSPPVEVIDNLVSVSTNDALSAKQGKELKDLIDVIPVFSNATETSRGASFLRKRIIGSNGADADYDIDTTAGNFNFADGSGSANIGAFTKQIDATWAQGSNAGGLAFGLSLTGNTTYHYFALSNAAGTVVDFGFDTSVVAANLRVSPAVIAALGAACKYERQLSVITTVSATIKQFYQTGVKFTWVEQVLDVYDFGNGTSATLSPLSTPIGIETTANIVVSIGDALNPPTIMYWILITSPSDTDNVPVREMSSFGFGRNTGYAWGLDMLVKTDTLSQIRWRHTAISLRPTGDYGQGLRIWSIGWHDFKLED